MRDPKTRRKFTGSPSSLTATSPTKTWSSIDSGRLGFPNTYFDPHKASILYNQYHEQYALADEVGFDDGIMSNEHHASYWCMKPAVNLDAAVIAKLTKNVKIAILGNVIAINDPIRMAEEIAMLDCYSGGRIISGFVRGTAVETLAGWRQPHREPRPLRGSPRPHHQVLDRARPLPLRGPVLSLPRREPVGGAHAEAPPRHLVPRHRQPRERRLGRQAQAPLHEPTGALVDTTEWLKQVYIDTAEEEGWTAGPEHFGYLLRCLVADTDEKAIELGKEFMWTIEHRQRGPMEHNDPPGYQSRASVEIKAQRPTGNVAGAGGLGVGLSYDQLRGVNNIIVGNPDTVTQKLTEVIERLSPGYIHIYGNEGAMDHKDTMRSIELLGKEVIPALHEVQLQPYDNRPRMDTIRSGTAGLAP